jgi:methylated-DNA-[protein]-cysteine S-methyltransferase
MTTTRNGPGTLLVESPVGPLMLHAAADGVTRLSLDGTRMPRVRVDGSREAAAHLDALGSQLDEYFAGSRTEFDVALALDGTPFQREVWDALRAIPYGMTVSYGELATRIGRPGAQRAVGLANGQNPVAIVVPCHRVIGADGSLTGYGGGLDRKRYLLGLEAGRTELPLPV